MKYVSDLKEVRAQVPVVVVVDGDVVSRVPADLMFVVPSAQLLCSPRQEYLQTVDLIATLLWGSRKFAARISEWY